MTHILLGRSGGMKFRCSEMDFGGIFAKGPKYAVIAIIILISGTGGLMASQLSLA